MGLGMIEQGSGFSAAKYFGKQGAKVTVTDLKKESELNKTTLSKLKNYKNIKL